MSETKSLCEKLDGIAADVSAAAVEAATLRRSHENCLLTVDRVVGDLATRDGELLETKRELAATLNELGECTLNLGNAGKRLKDCGESLADETTAHNACKAALAEGDVEITKLLGQRDECRTALAECREQLKPDLPEPPVELLRDFRFTFWQIPNRDFEDWSTLPHLAEIFKGLSVTAQNRWPGAFCGALFAERLGLKAAACEAAGFEFQPYISTRLTSVADVRALAAKDWPDNVRRLMANSEVKDEDQPWSMFPLYREAIPKTVALAVPEGVSIGSDSMVGTQEFFQAWLRVSGNATQSRDHQRRITNISAVMAVAKRLCGGKIPINIGPQLWNTSWARNETRENIRAAVFLAAQSGLKGAEIPTDIVAWGAKWITSDEPLETIAGAIREVNALEVSCDAEAEAAKVAVLIDDATNVRNWYAFQVVWEMVVRANIPYDVILRDDLRADVLAKYQAVVVPVLNDKTTETFTTTASRALRDCALAGRPVLTECGDAHEYGGHQGKPRIPAWATLLLSARYTREPLEWSPSFGDFSLLADGYETRMADLVEHYRHKVGAEFVTNTESGVVTRRFAMGGRLHYWDVDFTTGEMEVRASVEG